MDVYLQRGRATFNLNRSIANELPMVRFSILICSPKHWCVRRTVVWASSPYCEKQSFQLDTQITVDSPFPLVIGPFNGMRHIYHLRDTYGCPRSQR